MFKYKFSLKFHSTAIGYLQLRMHFRKYEVKLTTRTCACTSNETQYMFSPLDIEPPNLFGFRQFAIKSSLKYPVNYRHGTIGTAHL